MTPLVLLLLLTFFFGVALAFTLWAALTMGDAARREPGASPARRASGARRESAAPKPWEKVPAPEPQRERRLRRKEKGGAAGARGGAPQLDVPHQPIAAKNSLWERQPQLPQPRPEPVVKPRASRSATGPDPADEQRGGRVVVTPRKPNTDAFERFLESEKRRD